MRELRGLAQKLESGDQPEGQQLRKTLGQLKDRDIIEPSLLGCNYSSYHCMAQADDQSVEEFLRPEQVP
jgi:hypothetical protein